MLSWRYREDNISDKICSASPNVADVRVSEVELPAATSVVDFVATAAHRARNDCDIHVTLRLHKRAEVDCCLLLSSKQKVFSSNLTTSTSS